MNEKLSEQSMELIRRGYRVGNGAGAFFLRPILKTVFGCVWSRDWQSWFAPSEELARKAERLCMGLEDIFEKELSREEKNLVESLLPSRDK